MVTGAAASNDTLGPTLNARRRRRKELLDEDDSSDLSDESDDDDAPDRPANQIKFTKMPLRTRSGSSPVRGSALRNELPDAIDGPNANAPDIPDVPDTDPADSQPSLVLTSPSRPPDSLLPRGSLGTVDMVKGRARRDTITSSDMSSENEFDNSGFQKRRIKHVRKAASSHQLLPTRMRHDDTERDGRLEALHEGN
ncbi:Component of a membrane-bound complex containing the Tor2p kinase, partial [Ascochyta clinopodiicola]